MSGGETIAKDEELLRKYLLGDASEKEQEEVELWLMSEERAYDLLEAAEDDLIDDSLAGRLKGRALERFNNVFLAASERQHKLQFSRSFRRAINDFTPIPAPSPSPGVWSRLLDVLRDRPVFAYAGSVLMIVMLTASGWSLLQVAELQQELRSATDQLTDAGRERTGLKRQLDESQEAMRALKAQFGDLEASIAAAKVSSLPRLALTLMPGTLRSPGISPRPTLPQVRVTPNSPLVEFSLVLLNDSFTSYRVSLVDGERRELISFNRLAVSAKAQGKTIVVAVPAQILSDGDYSLILYGIADTAAAETVDRYDFRAVRQ
jgi:hypothetical protein